MPPEIGGFGQIAEAARTQLAEEARTQIKLEPKDAAYLQDMNFDPEIGALALNHFGNTALHLSCCLLTYFFYSFSAKYTILFTFLEGLASTSVSL